MFLGELRRFEGDMGCRWIQRWPVIRLVVRGDRVGNSDGRGTIRGATGLQPERDVALRKWRRPLLSGGDGRHGRDGCDGMLRHLFKSCRGVRAPRCLA